MRAPVLCLLLLCSSGIGAPSAAAERADGEEFRNEKVLEVAEFERVVDYPAKLTLRGKVGRGYTFSEALLVRPDGSAIVLRDLDLNRETGEFHVHLRLDRKPGIYRVELTARTGKNRTHSGARILLFAGVPEDHPDDPRPEDTTPDLRTPAEVLAVDMFRRVNAHRVSVGLKPLAWFEPLAKLARSHAQACLREKKLDHSVDGDGTVVERMEAEYGWGALVYRRPRAPRSMKKGAKSYFPTIIDGRRGLEPLLHRWQRFAAFCVPMTSEVMTHAACGIARTPKGTCYIVFTFAQIGGTEVLADAKRMRKQAARDVKTASDANRPARLRALGLWLDKGAVSEARRFRTKPDPALRGAALDVLLLIEPDDWTGRIQKELGRIGRTYERLAEYPDKPPKKDGAYLAGVLRVSYVPSIMDLARAVETKRHAAAQKALDAALAVDSHAPDPGTLLTKDPREAALEAVRRHWPGTPAADAATEALVK